MERKPSTRHPTFERVSRAELERNGAFGGAKPAWSGLLPICAFSVRQPINNDLTYFLSPLGAREGGKGGVGGGSVGRTRNERATAQSRGRGGKAPSRGGGQGRGAQPAAPARARVPAGNGQSPRRRPHAPQGQRPPRGEAQRGGARQQGSEATKAKRGGRGRGAGRAPRGEPPAPERAPDNGGGEKRARRERKDSRTGAQGQPHFCAQPTRERSERGASERSERASARA